MPRSCMTRLPSWLAPWRPERDVNYTQSATSTQRRWILSLMRGKTCVVTGASSGIGLETAVALAAAGARVAVVCRTAEKSERVAGEIRRRCAGADILPFAADLSSQPAVRAV